MYVCMYVCMYVHTVLPISQDDPKSITLIAVLFGDFSNIFSGFRSQCMILHVCIHMHVCSCMDAHVCEVCAYVSIRVCLLVLRKRPGA
jgi:hypothetical protein